MVKFHLQDSEITQSQPERERVSSSQTPVAITVIIVRNHNQLANQTKQKTGEKVNSIDTWARCRKDLLLPSLMNKIRDCK